MGGGGGKVQGKVQYLTLLAIFFVKIPTCGTGKYFKFDQISTTGDNKTV